MAMKNLKILFLTFFLFAASVNTGYPQDRNVYWVHGFNGDATAWQHYATIFTNERKINSIRLSYNTTSGLSTAASQLSASVNSTASTNMAIGHSMGGVMIREVDRTASPKKFGGYVTFASPNYGAPISNSILSGAVNSAATTAINNINAGPIAELFGLPWLIITNWTTSIFVDKLFNSITYLNSSTNNDLKEGSTAMNNLNNYNSTAQRISVIAQENSPVHWRFAATSAGMTETSMINVVNQVRGVYNDKYWFHENLRVACLVALNLPGAALHDNLAKQWKKGRDWIDDSETIWCSLIKTSRLEPYTYSVVEWVPCPQINPKIPPQPDCGEWKPVYYTGTQTVNYPSDGLIPTYAQELKGVSGGDRYTIEYANHMELKNMSSSTLPNGNPNDGTRIKLTAIFNRSGWFNTPIRP